MTITIVGAGAIGGTLGAAVSRAGEDVFLVDLAKDHVRAMQEHGLTILGMEPEETYTAPVRAGTPDDLQEPLQIVILAVKAQHTEDAVREILPRLAPDGYIASMQNGLCERIIAGLVGAERTVGCFVNFSADYLEPGVIQYGGLGSLFLGELDGSLSPRVLALQRILSAYGDVRVTDNIWGYLWGKLGYANMLFATALTNETMADAIDRYRPLMVDLAAEVYEVAAREGVYPEPFDSIEPSLYFPRATRDEGAIFQNLDDLVARRRRDVKVRSGIWRDLAVRQRRTEVDQQIGLVAEIGKEHGLPMTLTRAVISMIHELEEGRRNMTDQNLDELDALRAGEALLPS